METKDLNKKLRLNMNPETANFSVDSMGFNGMMKLGLQCTAGISRKINQRGAGSRLFDSPMDVFQNGSISSSPGVLACLGCWNNYFGSG